MSEIGWVLFVVGIVAAVVGFLQRRKLTKMNTVPYRAPSEIVRMGASAGDAKAMVSTEGTVNAPRALVAPMSGQPCLGYEVTIERKWEKVEDDGKGGTTTKTGTDVLLRKYEGSQFQISDAGGSVWIDASKEPDADLDRSYSNTERVGLIAPSAVAFGSMQFQLPILPRDSRTTAIVGSERILKPSGTMYALGGIEMGAQGPTIGTPKGMMTGRLMLSAKGRAALVQTTQRNMKLGFAFGGAFAVIGLPMGILAPHASAESPTSTTPAAIVAPTATPSLADPAAVPAPTANAGAPGASARTLALGALEHGQLREQDPTQPMQPDGVADEYTVQLTAGQPVTIFTRGGPVVGSTPDSHLDVLTVLLCNGAEVARDDDGGGGTDSRIAYVPTASGACTVRITGFAGSVGAYTVQVLNGTLQSEHDQNAGGTRRAGHRR